MLGILEKIVDATARKKILEGLGREGAPDSHALMERYKNNLDGFLAEPRESWVESAEVDAKAGVLRVVGNNRACVCPLVNDELGRPECGSCSLGWQKEAYSAVLGKPAEAELEESILRGGKRCIFQVKIA